MKQQVKPCKHVPSVKHLHSPVWKPNTGIHSNWPCKKSIKNGETNLVQLHFKKVPHGSKTNNCNRSVYHLTQPFLPSTTIANICSSQTITTTSNTSDCHMQVGTCESRYGHIDPDELQDHMCDKSTRSTDDELMHSSSTIAENPSHTKYEAKMTAEQKHVCHEIPEMQAFEDTVERCELENSCDDNDDHSGEGDYHATSQTTNEPMNDEPDSHQVPSVSCNYNSMVDKIETESKLHTETSTNCQHCDDGVTHTDTPSYETRSNIESVSDICHIKSKDLPSSSVEQRKTLGSSGHFLTQQPQHHNTCCI